MLMLLLYIFLLDKRGTIEYESLSEIPTVEPKEFQFSSRKLLPTNATNTIEKKNEQLLSIENDEYELGNAFEGRVVSGEAKLINKSENDICIERIVSSCGCSTSNVSTHHVLSGQTLTIPFSIRTDGKNGGFVARYQVDCRPEESSEIIPLFFCAKVNIQTPGQITAFPAVVSFGKHDPASEVKQDVSLCLADGLEDGFSPPTIIKVESPEWIYAEINPIAQTSDKTYEGKLKLSGTVPNSSGSISDTIRITTDHPRYPVTTIPVSIDIAGYVDLEPRRLIHVTSCVNFPLSMGIHVRFIRSGVIEKCEFTGMQDMECDYEFSDETTGKIKLKFELKDKYAHTMRQVFKGEFVVSVKIQNESHRVAMPLLIIVNEK